MGCVAMSVLAVAAGGGLVLNNHQRVESHNTAYYKTLIDKTMRSARGSDGVLDYGEKRDLILLGGYRGKTKKYDKVELKLWGDRIYVVTDGIRRWKVNPITCENFISVDPDYEKRWALRRLAKHGN